MSFKTEIEAIVGDIDSPDYTSEAAIYLADGVKFITKYVMRDPSMADRLTSSTTLNNSTPTKNMNSVLMLHSVVRNDGARNRKAIEIEAEDVDNYTDVNSIYYTSKLDPKWYISNDVLNVIPTPTSSQTAVVKAIDPDSSVAVTDRSVTNFPAELERGIVLYSSKQLLRKFLSVKNSSLPADMSIPSTPSAGSVSTVTVGSLGSAPSYSKTSLSLTNAPSISNLTISASVPSVISLDTVSYTDPAAGDASAATISTVNIASVADANVTTGNSAISALPAYTPASINMTGAPGISSLTVNESAPNAPSITDVGVGSLGSAPAYAPPSLNLDSGTLSGSDTSAGTETALGLDDFIYDEDPEMAQILLAKQQQQINKYQADIANQANEFNENVAAYQANVQKILAQAEQEQSESVQGIQKYSAEIEAYQTTVNKKIQEFQVNTQKELDLWQTKRQTELAQYQSDIQNQANEYQEKLGNYQAEVQEELQKQNVALERVSADATIAAQKAQQDAANATDVAKFNKQKDLQISMETRARDMDALIANNNAKVSDYQARVQSYGAQVNDQVQEYQLNLEKELGLFNTKRNTELQKHQNDIQDELNEFQKELSIYQADLQQKIEQARVSSEKEAMEIQQYATEVESYGQQIQKEVQNFTTKLQKVTTDYQWYVDQHNKASQELVEFLSYYIYKPELMEDDNEASANDRAS